MPAPYETIRASCVIPAYNTAETIGRALESVLRTPGVEEVIVVDDGSVDETGIRVAALAGTAPVPVRLIRQDNSGAGAARNTGMQAATLDWITFLDADDEMLPEAIIGKAKHLATCPDRETVDAVHGSFVRGDTGAIAKFSETRTQVDPDGIGRLGGFPGGVHSFVFRREPLLATGGFRPELTNYEDFELILRFIAQGSRVVGCTAPGFHRHYTQNSLSRGLAVPKRLELERRFLNMAAREDLMGKTEVMRRLLRNRVRQLHHVVTGH
ncbi:glycosyltransferase family 2 protein [Haliea sp.]